MTPILAIGVGLLAMFALAMLVAGIVGCQSADGWVHPYNRKQ